ncbi:Eukaryotic phosphomannomutase [Mycena sanguinolenta]|uniref:Phosphomannomutase n=1 Tax=Mycena sanguinolenta TaxID=230812 RepID=A0A8H6Z5D1_9AGAR|nr:Eukaryotic phosphomannomutase [Mycena sanguinolenta]
MVSSAFADRPNKKLVLFDVDETLTLARQSASPEMIQVLSALKQKYVIGVVSGSNMVKISEQLVTPVIEDFDYVFTENGLVAYKKGKLLESQSFINYIGEDRGTFVEFRSGMINVSPLGRNATIAERNQFEAYDKQHNVRAKFIEVLKEKFPDYGLTYSIGGKISFDVFPHGWDKTYCLKHVADEEFEEIHFVGDKTQPGGNDYEIYADPRTIGHSVDGPAHTIRLLKEKFLNA